MTQPIGETLREFNGYDPNNTGLSRRMEQEYAVRIAKLKESDSPSDLAELEMERDAFVAKNYNLVFSAVPEMSDRFPEAHIDDLFEEGFNTLLKCALGFRDKGWKFSSYFYGALEKNIQRFFERKKRRKEQQIFEEDYESGSRAPIGDNLYESLRGAIGRLPHRLERIASSFYANPGDNDHMTLTELSKEFGVGKSRMTQLLQKTLETLGNDKKLIEAYWNSDYEV